MFFLNDVDAEGQEDPLVRDESIGRLSMAAWAVLLLASSAGVWRLGGGGGFRIDLVGRAISTAVSLAKGKRLAQHVVDSLDQPWQSARWSFECFLFVLFFWWWWWWSVVVSDVGGHQTEAIQLLSIGDPMISNV